MSALLESQVDLPCNTTSSNPGNNDQVLLVLWFKDPEDRRPFYTYDNRGGGGAKHWSDEDFLEGRGSFKAQRHRGARLTLKNVRPADAGTFRCRVDFKFAPTSVTKTQLSVIGKPPTFFFYNIKTYGCLLLSISSCIKSNGCTKQFVSVGLLSSNSE